MSERQHARDNSPSNSGNIGSKQRGVWLTNHYLRMGYPMKIIQAYPPNFVQLARHFPIKGRQGIIFAWGDRIYNPSGIKIAPWLLAHEEVHGARQSNPRAGFVSIEERTANWWDLYIHSPEFRLREEIPAHQQEWEVYTSQGQMRHEDQAHYLEAMIQRLSGPLYGNLTSPQAAEDYILKRRFA